MFNFTTPPVNSKRPLEKRFDVYKREESGDVHKVGTVMAATQQQAQVRAFRLWKPVGNEDIWASERVDE